MLPFGVLSPNPQFAFLVFSLSAVSCWGTSDFLGGYASRSARAFLVTAIANGSGLLAISAVALLTRASFPSRESMLWALAAGAFGGCGLAIFYRALAAGKMGLTASVASVLAVGIPTVFAMLTEGLPGRAQIAGFALAGVGMWLISRPDKNEGSSGIGWAVLAGIGFAGFFLFIKQAGHGSALWIAAASRVAAFICTAAMVLIGRTFAPLPKASALFAAIAGCLDVSGSALFVRATQTGRLDVAVMLVSLYPVVTVVLARVVLKERFTRWKTVGMFAALAAVPLIAS
jgi:drug/metabolite transporter (DMT)-like permease